MELSIDEFFSIFLTESSVSLSRVRYNRGRPNLPTENNNGDGAPSFCGRNYHHIFQSLPARGISTFPKYII